LEIDIDALAGYVQRLVQCYSELGKNDQLEDTVRAFETAIDAPRWRDKVMLFRAQAALGLKWNKERASRLLARLCPDPTKLIDADLISLFVALCGDRISPFQLVQLLERAADSTDSPAERFRFLSQRGFRMMLSGDQESGVGAVRSALAAFDVQRQPPYSDAELDYLADTLSVLGTVEKDGALLERSWAYTKELLNDYPRNNDGRMKSLRRAADIEKRLGRHGMAAASYQAIYSEFREEVDLLFAAECYISAGDMVLGRELFDRVDPDRLDAAGKADRALVFPGLAGSSRSRVDLDRARAMLLGLETLEPYFESQRLDMLRLLDKWERELTAGGKPTGVSAVLSNIADHIELKPNLFGIGFNFMTFFKSLAKGDEAHSAMHKTAAETRTSNVGHRRVKKSS
jgi:hypothetical protein